MKNYIAISGSIFAIVAFAHLIRIIDGWEVIVNGQAVPMTISYMAFVVVFELTSQLHILS